MSKLEGLLLGILQGLTEFLPVSSSGHLVIAQHYIPNFKQSGVLFDAMLHFGTTMAVIIYFWRDIKALLSAFIPGRQGWGQVLTFDISGSEHNGCNERREKCQMSRPDPRIHRKIVGLIGVGTVFTGLIGVVFEDYFIRLFSSVTTASSMLLVTGGLLLAAGLIRQTKRNEADLNVMDAIYIGVAQGIAIIPGISRSGATISTGLFRGINGVVAAKFSFLLSIPAVLGAVFLESRHINLMDSGEITTYVLGTLSAFITGLVAIRFLLGVIKRNRLRIFAYYCFLMGGLSLVFQTLNVF